MTAVIIFVQTTTFRRDPRHRQQKRNSRESAVWCAGIDVMVRPNYINQPVSKNLGHLDHIRSKLQGPKVCLRSTRSRPCAKKQMSTRVVRGTSYIGQAAVRPGDPRLIMSQTSPTQRILYGSPCGRITSCASESARAHHHGRASTVEPFTLLVSRSTARQPSTSGSTARWPSPRCCTPGRG
jgi:hypothetical protein